MRFLSAVRAVAIGIVLAIALVISIAFPLGEVSSPVAISVPTSVATPSPTPTPKPKPTPPTPKPTPTPTLPPEAVPTLEVSTIKPKASSPKPSKPKASPESGSYSIYRGPNASSYVILTYDDCPKSLESFRAMVLGAEKLNVALVLFPTGNCLQTGRFDAEYARAHGHYVFNHSVDHADLTQISYQAILRELGPPGVATTYGRPPYGARNATVAKAYAAKGMRMWLWNVDTNDWRGKSSATLVEYVTTTTKPGQTVLMHMQWNGFNTETLAKMQSGLAARGMTICRNYPGVAPAAPQGNLRC